MSLPVLQLILLLMMALLFIGLVVWCMGKVLDALSEPVQDPEQKLIGQTGRVVASVRTERGGKILVMGEIWDAVLGEVSVEDASITTLEPDVLVRVVGFDSVDPRTLRVAAIE